MYALDINFLDDRKGTTVDAAERPPIADTQFLIGGGALMAVALALAAGGYFFIQYSASGVQQQLDDLNAQEKTLDAKLADLAGSVKSIKAIDDRTSALVSLFVGDIPASAVLDEVKLRTPVNIRINTITQQADKTIKINGQGASFNDVNDFLLLLQTSPYLDPIQTRIESARRQEDKSDGSISLVDYDITATLTSKPATQLLADLERSGATGIVTRIKFLQQRGVITQ